MASERARGRSAYPHEAPESSDMGSERARHTSVFPQQAAGSSPMARPQPGGVPDTSVSSSTLTVDSQTPPPQPGRRRGEYAILPDRKVTLFAVKLAIIEKLASCLGYLAFIWATVVLLGGFASSLKTEDFWVVTAILSTEGFRILGRSQEVKWHHETMLKSMATVIDEAKRLGNKLFRCTGSNTRNENSRVDHDDPLNKAWMSFVSVIHFLLQLFSALAYIALSFYRLVNLLDRSGDSNKQSRNMEPALIFFYCLSLLEALLIVLEKLYWAWKIYKSQILRVVNQEYGLVESELYTVERFFYATYARCVDGSVFDGLKMEFVKHSVELLQSGSGSGQLAGARVLCKLAEHKDYAENTLRAIGTTRDVVERMIDILNFGNREEREIRIKAAQIISKLVENNLDTNNQDNINRDCIRVTAIDGFMESIASLLYSKDISPEAFFSLGLTILRNLAYERSNHDKIASSRGLLPRIVALIEPLERQPLIRSEQLERQKLALQIVQTLASTTGSKGKALRKQIREIVFSISNLRKVLRYQEESKRSLQILAIDTLTSLASEKEGREIIGGTGEVLDQLFALFYKERSINLSEPEGDTSEKKKLAEKAIEALGFLSLESEHNCEIMMKLEYDHQNLIESLIKVLNESAEKDPVQFMHVARILRNLLVHAKAADVHSSEISSLVDKVPKFVVTNFSCQSPQSEQHSCCPLEAAIGLAAQFFSFMTKWDLVVQFQESSGISTESLISKVVVVITNHPSPLKEVPNIRRFSLELLNAVMLNAFIFSLEIIPVIEGKRLELVKALKDVMNTTSDWEYYNAFSGSMGLSRHGTSIRYLAEYAMESFPAS